jgi:sugar/nucleoside kinase (ribokinase family)
MDDLELLSIGDASLDVFLTPTETEEFCQIDTKECFIAFSYGDKVPVKDLAFSIGGNAANNAVGTRRLGVASAVMLTLGDDNIGNQIVEKLIKEGVDTSYVFRQKSTASNYSTVISYGGERTILTYKAPRSYEFPVQMPSVPWVYLTSMGETFRPFYNHLADWLKKNTQVKLAFNPGSRQLRAGLEAIREIMTLTFIIYVNRKEAEDLTGMESSQGKEKELLTALCQLGPKVSIITDGANGSYLYDGKRFIKAGVLPIDAFERTGAGDAFGAGCIAALIKGKSWEEALLWGTVNSASVIGYIGSQKGLLRSDEIVTWLERAKSSNVKVVKF